MFSAFHYNANRGDKRFKQMYKSNALTEEKRRPDRELSFEDSISRARNNRQLLVEKFRQIQSHLKEEAEDQNSNKSHEDSSQDEFTTKDKYSSSSKDVFSSTKDATSFKEFNFPSSSSRPISTTSANAVQSTSGRSKPRGSISAFDSNSCEGFDYSSSFNKKLGDNFTFNMENFSCSTEDIFDKTLNIDREKLRNEIWDSMKFEDNELLLCPGCVQNYMKLKDSSLLCNSCTLQIDLSSPNVSIRMIKEQLKQKLDSHKENCKERVKYKFKDEKLFIGCKHCNKEFYIS